MWRALQGQNFEIWGDGTAVRDFVYVEDVANAILRTLTYSGPELVMNVGAGVGTSVSTVVERVYRACGADPSLVKLAPSRPVDVQHNVLCTDLIKREVDWSPTTGWEDGLARTLAWMSKAFDCQLRLHAV
jgi:UDP-glucose 4-epimerase